MVINDYAVTFGQQYRNNKHPRSINGVSPHPDGWVVVQAPNISRAHQIANEAFGDYWSFMYPMDEFEADKRYYPLGELGRIIW